MTVPESVKDFASVMAGKKPEEVAQMTEHLTDYELFCAYNFWGHHWLGTDLICVRKTLELLTINIFFIGRP